MGHEALYRCLSCGHEFRSHEGGGFLFIEFRCVQCDWIKAVESNRRVPPESYRPPTSEEIGLCPRCGGELRSDLEPMCPGCGSRNVEVKEIQTFYD